MDSDSCSTVYQRRQAWEKQKQEEEEEEEGEEEEGWPIKVIKSGIQLHEGLSESQG